MKLASILVLLTGALPAARPPALPPAMARPATTGRAQILESLAFEENRGQFDRRVEFVLRAPDYTAFFLRDRVTIGFRARDGGVSTISMRLCRMNPHSRLEGLDPVAIRTSYFRGRDAARWVRDAPHYSKVRYRDVYPGVDLVFRQDTGQQLEYDWVVAPGGDPAAIRTGFDRGTRLVSDAAGDLAVSKGGFTWRHRRPVAYQEGEWRPTPVGASFRIYTGRESGFEVARYDRERPLVIDPVAIFSMVFGGHGESGTVGGFNDAGNAIAFNPANNSVYVAGTAVSLNFPRGYAKFQEHNEGSDAFVAWVSINQPPLGTVDNFNVYFLGGSQNDAATGVALDPQGNVYLTGYTFSTDFPLVNPMQTAPSGGFIAKFSPDFSTLAYATYVGSAMTIGPISFPLAIAADSGGNAYVTGTADPSLFTATSGAFQSAAAGGQPAFALKLDPSGKLVYATFLGTGDGGGDYGYGMAVDSASEAYVTGFAGSKNFPTTAGVIQPACTANNSGDLCTGAFVTKLNAGGTAAVYSTFLGGGSTATAGAVAVDAAGNSYVAGRALTPESSFPGAISFPTTPGAFQSTTQAGIAAFVTKLNPTGTALIYSTLLAGSTAVFADGGTSANAIAVGPAGNAYVTGWTEQADFPLVKPLQTAIGSENICLGSQGVGSEICGDAFVSKLSPDGSALEWSTFLGGSDYDSGAGIAVGGDGVYVTGVTVSFDFPGGATPSCIYTDYTGCDGTTAPGSAFLVHLNESADAAGLSAPGVTNAASFVTGLTPGGVATIFGTGFTNSTEVLTATCCPLPTELGGVSVNFGSAPLLAVSSSQINFVVPWDLQVQTVPAYVSVIVSVNGVASLPIQATAWAYQPALYLADGIHAIAQHSANFSAVTTASPAQPGEVVILYGNGLGDVQPEVALGAAAPSSPLATTVVNPVVTIGGVQAEVLFSGLTPGLINLYQLNVRVPQSAQSGDQDVTVTVNGGGEVLFTGPTVKLPVS
jgi:uncharacterized protein (TIGR03437 family)